MAGSPAAGFRVLYRRWWGLWRNQAEIARLGGEEAPGARSLSLSLAASIAGDLSPEEKAWTERIESLRRELSSSPRKLRLEDWGAVSPGRRGESSGEGPVSVERTVGEICRSSASRPRRARLLFRLVRELKPRLCLELGTSLGLSAAYIAAALELNGEGRLTTLEGAREVAAIAGENLSRLGLGGRGAVVVGRFRDRLPEVLRESSPCDFAFVDGHHDEGPTLAYFEALLPRLAPGACLIFDDVSWSRGMERAWRRIAADPRIGIAVDLFTMGIVLKVPVLAPRFFRVAAV